jgi:hypothetical protein
MVEQQQQTQDSEFRNMPPEFGDNTGPGFMPPGADMAWLLSIIKLNLNNTSLPDGIKKSLLADMVPYIDCAGMTNITKGQVLEFLGGFEELWLRYRIFKVKKKYVPELNYVMAYLREILLMTLNKSIDGWQGNHVFERKTTANLRLVRSEYLQQLKHSILRRRPVEEVK